jgi:hypothetical protein
MKTIPLKLWSEASSNQTVSWQCFSVVAPDKTKTKVSPTSSRVKIIEMNAYMEADTLK